MITEPPPAERVGSRIPLKEGLNIQYRNHEFLSTRGEAMKTFADKAYDLLRKVPKGRVTTYKEIAHALGTKAYRGIGQAMKRNPYAPEVP